jgi:hypothetical protein
MFDVPKVEGIKNPTGVGTNPDISAALEKYNESIEDYAKQLEQRYARPNLYKVAAGFLKPQLGGFAASLGSASEAFGEQEELQRAIAPTVAQMRSQLALNQYGLSQSTAASKIAEKAAKEGRITNPTEASDIAALTQGPGAVPAAGQASSTAQLNQLAQAISSGISYSELVAKFPKSFVDQHLPILMGMIPGGVKPPEGTPAGLLGVAAPAAPAAPGAPAGGQPAEPQIPGVPESTVGGMPLAAQLAAQAKNVDAMQEERNIIGKDLAKQAATATPIFEASTNLYKAASNPDLEKAFGVFEKGDPLGALGKAVESGSFPLVLEKMRAQIIAARLGSDREKRAISDLQAMEGALAELKVQMNNGVINPTDFRSVAEGESIPGIRNTQDAFLRGTARIGSTALSKYETNAAFNKALKSPDFNVREWMSSPYYRDVQENAKKRTQSLITNRASQELPLFMSRGLSGSFGIEDKKPSGSGTPKDRPNERKINGQTYVRQPDGNYKLKEQ